MRINTIAVNNIIIALSPDANLDMGQPILMLPLPWYPFIVIGTLPLDMELIAGGELASLPQ